MKNNKRKVDLDILKTLGVATIILAHVDAPNWVMQLRNFSVPLLVFVAGAVYSLTSRSKSESYVSYIKKRLMRLVIPTWIFLTLFFATTAALFGLVKQPYPFDLQTIGHSYLFSHFTQAITGVWIMRVFVLLALAAPAFLWIKNRIRKTQYYFFALFVILIAFDWGIEQYTRSVNDILDYGISSYLFYLIPYGVVYALGMVLPSLSRPWLLAVIAASGGLFVIGGVLAESAGIFSLTQDFKYPPRLYYLSYGLLCSVVLYFIYKDKVIGDKRVGAMVKFISMFSLPIYFWHIVFLYWWDWIGHYVINLSADWITKYIVVFGLSLAAVYIQKRLGFLVRLYIIPLKRAKR